MSSDDIDLRQFPMADWRSGHGASEDHKWVTSDGSRKNHDNPGINTPRPPKSSARLVAVGLTSRRDMPDVLFVGVAGNWQFQANLALPSAWKRSADASQDAGEEF